jgi:hypothetical protein
MKGTTSVSPCLGESVRPNWRSYGLTTNLDSSASASTAIEMDSES